MFELLYKQVRNGTKSAEQARQELGYVTQSQHRSLLHAEATALLRAAA